MRLQAGYMRLQAGYMRLQAGYMRLQVCDECSATANFVAGVADLPQLGLVAMPGTSASVSFHSGSASPSPPMAVAMRQCRPGEYLDASARLCRACEAGRFANQSGAAARSKQCTPPPLCLLRARLAAPGSSVLPRVLARPLGAQPPSRVLELATL